MALRREHRSRRRAGRERSGCDSWRTPQCLSVATYNCRAVFTAHQHCQHSGRRAVGRYEQLSTTVNIRYAPEITALASSCSDIAAEPVIRGTKVVPQSKVIDDCPPVIWTSLLADVERMVGLALQRRAGNGEHSSVFPLFEIWRTPPYSGWFAADLI